VVLDFFALSAVFVRDLHLALAFGLGYHCTLVMLILLYL
jgi:hypothetical protein